MSVFMHLCLCVSKGVYAVHCHAHFPLLHVCIYMYSCVYVQSVEYMRMLYYVCLCSGACVCVSRSVYVYSAVLLPPLPIVHFIINLFLLLNYYIYN